MQTPKSTGVSQKGRPKQTPAAKRGWLLLLFVATTVFLAVVFFFNERQPSFSVLTINGVDGVFNHSKSFYLEQYRNRKQEGEPKGTALVVEEGDVLEMEKLLFQVGSSTDSLSFFHGNAPFYYLNGKLVGLALEQGDNLLPWFSKMTGDSIRELDYLLVDTGVVNAYLPFLRTIALDRPNLAIEFLGSPDTASFRVLTHLFSPRLVSLTEAIPDLSQLASLKNLETLVLALDKPGNPLLPNLPSLKQCIVFLEDSIRLPENFFANTPSIEKLAFPSAGDAFTGDSLLFLRSLPRLKELVLGSKGKTDVDHLFQLVPNLTVLVLGDSSTSLSSLPKLKALQWLGLPRSTTQIAFDSVVPKLEDLAMLSMVGHDSLVRLNALRDLKALKGLVIRDTVADRQTLLQLKQLRYLSLPQTLYEDSFYRRKLEKALPGTIIVPNSGVCLGSGWLLLLVPLTVILLLVKSNFAKRKRHHHA